MNHNLIVGIFFSFTVYPTSDVTQVIFHGRGTVDVTGKPVQITEKLINNAIEDLHLRTLNQLGFKQLTLANTGIYISCMQTLPFYE